MPALRRRGWARSRRRPPDRPAARRVLDGGFVPGSSWPSPALSLSGLWRSRLVHVALLGERAVAVLGVVAGEGEIAERVQPVFCTRCQSAPSACSPGRREVRGSAAGYARWCIRPPAPAPCARGSPAGAASSCGSGSCRGHGCAGRGGTHRRPGSGGTKAAEEVRLDALEVTVLLERLAEGGEGLVHRVGGDGADGAAEHVRLDQPHRRGEVGGAERTGRVVVIQLEQEG